MDTLTDNDRAYFAQHMPGDVRSKALRIIDQQNEALVAYLGKTLGLEAEVERLQAVLVQVNAHALAKMQETAAANALLGECYDWHCNAGPEDDPPAGLAAWHTTHLDGQPATAQTYNERVLAAAELVFARTPAEQAVLDAFDLVPDGSLKFLIHTVSPLMKDVIGAELARREGA